MKDLFYSPWMLLGALAISIPLILHFFYRARYRKLPWGAMTFLKIAMEQTSRRLRFQEWILLALRCLALMLLALAIARPQFNGSVGGRGDAVDAVFLFDTSYSMTARDGDKNRLERAKAAAIAVLEKLPPQSTVRVISCSDRPVDHGPFAPGNRDQVRQAIEEIELTSLSTDYLPGVEKALEAIKQSSGTSKEFYFFSDLGKSGFERQTDRLHDRLAEIKTHATVLIVRSGDAKVTPPNAAITDITFPSSVPHKGSRMPFTVMLRNSGSKPVLNLQVTLEVDCLGSEKETISIPSLAAGSTTPVTMTALLSEAGLHVVTAKIISDEVPGDNRFDRVISVKDRLNVLIIDGEPDRGDSRDSASHFIRNSLAPVKATESADYFIRLNVVAADEAGPGLLAGCDLVVMANVPASDADKPGVPGLSEEFVLRLSEFVRGGGSLVIGSGDNIVPARYNAVLGSGGVNILPFDLEEVVNTTIESPFKIAADSIDATSYLSRFRDEPFRTANADVEIFQMLKLGPGDAQARVLMRTSDARPVVVIRSLGAGDVLFITTSLDTRWSNWAVKAGAYVSFVQMTLAHLTNKKFQGTNSIAGEPLVWSPNDYAKSFDLVKPDGTKKWIGAPSGGGAERYTLNAESIVVAGVYRFESEGTAAIRSPPFAVNPDLRESDDLESLTDEALEAQLGFKPIMLKAQAESDAVEAISAERSRRSWVMIALLVLLFVLAFGESLWAFVCGRAW